MESLSTTPIAASSSRMRSDSFNLFELRAALRAAIRLQFPQFDFATSSQQPVSEATPDRILLDVEPEQSTDPTLMAAGVRRSGAFATFCKAMKLGNRAWRVQVISQCAPRIHQTDAGLDIDATTRKSKCTQRFRRLRQALARSNRLAADNASEAYANRNDHSGQRCHVSLQQLVDRHEISERLRHLLAFDLQEAVVHPVIRHHRRVEGAARLGDFVFVVRKHEIDAAAVDVEGLAEIFPRTSPSIRCASRRPARGVI